MALPTNGRVIIETTVGEIEMELWSKETPRACRNFIALAMEGYYDGVIFHRVVPGFLVQTGDRTGTGGGGESFYGEQFEDEIHPRLRFAHRGIVGMANNGKKNSNDSQFFITLDRADELHGKHTLFGRCLGDTIYNVMKIGEMELDGDGRPVYPPKIKSVRIIENPFPDIVPRITAAEKRAQHKAKEQAQKERELEISRRGAKKNVKLLSFVGDEEEAPEEEFQKKPIFRPELVEVKQKKAVPDFVSQPGPSSRPPRAASPQAVQPKADKPGKKKEDQKDIDITKIREQHAKEQASSEHSRKAEIEKMEAEIRKLQKRRDGDLSDEEKAYKKPKTSYLSEELAKYSKGRGLHKKGKRRDEGDVLAALNSFRGKLQSSMSVDDPEPAHDFEGDDAAKNRADPAVEDPGMEVDDDIDFMAHRLQFSHDNKEETEKAERDYEVIDPRARGAQAREEERQRKKAAIKAKGGAVRDGRYRRS